MRNILILSFLFGACFLGSEINGQSKNENESKTKLVQNLILLKKQGISVSYYSKQNLRLGDISATLLLEIFTLEEMLQKENLSSCLSILQISFMNLEAIENPVDRMPFKTMSLLEDLREKSKDPSSISLVDDAIKNIGDLTKSSNDQQ